MSPKKEDGVSMADVLKRRAAERALEYVRSGMKLGLGTGSTMAFVLEELGRRMSDGVLRDIVGVPTSQHTARHAQVLSIPLTDFTSVARLDLAIDGADEIDPQLNLIKGLGGALLREKIVASATTELVIVADETKLVQQLGERVVLPIEVIQLALPLVRERLGPERALLRRIAQGAPFVTDEGNYIIDYACGPIADPAALADELRRIVGVVDHGLFLNMATHAIVAASGGVQVIERG